MATGPLLRSRDRRTASTDSGSVRPTDLTISCAAGARVPKPRGTPVAAGTRVDATRSATGVTPQRLGWAAAGSAGGPKPGRTSFIVKLDGAARRFMGKVLNARRCAHPRRCLMRCPLQRRYIPTAQTRTRVVLLEAC